MRTYVKPHLAGDPFEIFHDDADGVRSQQGWYYEDDKELLCGPFHSQHAAETHAENTYPYEYRD